MLILNGMVMLSICLMMLLDDFNSGVESTIDF